MTGIGWPAACTAALTVSAASLLATASAAELPGQQRGAMPLAPEVASMRPAARPTPGAARLQAAPLRPAPEPERSFGFYDRAASDGDEAADLQAALMLIHGRGVKRDVATGFARLQRRAQTGHTGAQLALARLLRDGLPDLLPPCPPAPPRCLPPPPAMAAKPRRWSWRRCSALAPP